jgi:hypothetical protein
MKNSGVTLRRINAPFLQEKVYFASQFASCFASFYASPEGG